MSIPRLLGALALLGISGAALALGTTTAVPWHATERAVLRLSWSARPERIERCRDLSAEEIAALPTHMQRTVECEVHFATYDLVVSVDGVIVDSTMVHGGGLRNDRPLYLLRDLTVAPGERQIRIALTRREAGSALDDAVDRDADDADDSMAESSERPAADGGRSARERETRRQRRLAALAPQLLLDTLVTLEPGRVALVTYDGRGDLVLVR